VAIASVTYLYANEMIGDMSATAVVPTMQFLKQNDNLLVYKCDSNINWTDVTIDGTYDNDLTGIMKVGQRIQNCTGDIVISFGSQLVGTWEFN